MGCDIHMFAEKRNSETSKWEKVGEIFEDDYYDKNRPITAWNTPFTDEPYSGRCYDLFAILADVRNGYGFAGIKTGEGFNPISDPKGVPDDASPEYLEKVSHWEGDGHSHSWFTVKELKDYDWGQLTFKRGVISYAQYQELKEKGGAPEMWCGEISGKDILTLEEEDINIIDQPLEELYPDKQLYVTYRWSDTYANRAKYFLDHTIPKLEKLGEPENVRIVFFFDN